MMENKMKVLLLHIVIAIFIKLVNSNSTTVSKMKALYVLGDSTVDCGENTLFFPFLLNNLSLHPCDGPPFNILPHLLGISISFSSFYFYFCDVFHEFYFILIIFISGSLNYYGLANRLMTQVLNILVYL